MGGDVVKILSSEQNFVNNYLKQANLTDYLSDSKSGKKSEVSDFFSNEADDIQSFSQDRAYDNQFENSKFSKSLDTLVSDGTLTKEQEDGIKDVFKQAMQGASSGYSANTTNPLDYLVSSGTITSDQKDAIQNVFKANYNG